MDFIVRLTDVALPQEIPFPESHPYAVIKELAVTLRASADVGNRSIRLQTMASSSRTWESLNISKAVFNAIVDALNEDTAVTDTDYAGVETEDATSYATGDTLADALKSAINTALAKLDLDVLVTDTDYEATCAVTAASATTPATLITIANDIRAMLVLLGLKLEEDCTSGYEEILSPLYITILSALTTTETSDTTVQASETVLHLFQTGMTDATVANAAHLMNLANPISLLWRMSLWISDANAVTANDRVDVYLEADLQESVPT